MESDMGKLLDVLGNRTRRRILILLTKRPYYVSELSQELGVGQKAVLEHLRILKSAGLVEERTERIPRGRPRKYYAISRGFRLEVMLTPYLFGTELYEPRGRGKGALYEEARSIIKSAEPLDEKLRDLVDFLDELEEKLDETMRLKNELEEVRLLIETYIENLMRRTYAEDERTFEILFKEIKARLPKDLREKIEGF
ncbi:ArsR/SmtB family transcription factor [Thermococcus sp.]